MNDKFYPQIVSIVGDEMAADLRSNFIHGYEDVINDAYRTPIVLNDQEVEYIVPDRCLAAFECEYCSSGFVLNLNKQVVKCPGCGAFVSYEMIMRAITPMRGIMKNKGPFYPPNIGGIGPSGSHNLPDNIRYGLATGSSVLARGDPTVGLSQGIKWSGIHDIANVPTPYPRVGAWKGELITDENRDRIHQEMIGYYKTLHLGS